MSYYDFMAGQQQARFGSVLGQMRAQGAARDWENYAHQLEARLADTEAALAQARAETLAARIQRNTYCKQLDRLAAQVTTVAPNFPMANQAELVAEEQRIVDNELAKHNLMIDRTNMKAQVVRRLR